MKKLNIKNIRQNGVYNMKVHSSQWLKSFKITSLASAITGLICSAVVPTYAADIEIYKVPEDSTGTTTLMMMLDLSGSMTYDDTGQVGSRLVRLKNGMRDVLIGTPANPPIDNQVVMGLATFQNNNGQIRLAAKALGVETGNTINAHKQRWYRIGTGNSSYRYATCTENYSTGGCKLWGTISTNNTNPGTGTASGNYGADSCNFGSSCRVYYINESRAETHRDVLRDVVQGLSASGSTPTAYAYAEAAAYMMGQEVAQNDLQAFFVRSNDQFKRCTSWSGTSCIAWTSSWTNNFFNDAERASYIKGGTGTVSSQSGNYYIGRDWVVHNYTGFSNSVEDSKSGNSYIAPTSITEQLTNADKRECSGQGIYFLTDGQPNMGGTATGSNGLSGTSYTLMKQTLSTKGNTFSCADSPLGNRTEYSFNNNGWSCIGKYAQALLDPAKNPIGLQLKTAVVGFGSDFSNDVTGDSDVEDAKDWGIIGGGGWYSGSSSEDVVNSINGFIKELNKDIPSMSTGSSTIPMDSLNPEVIQPYAYFPQFEPKVKPEDTQQLWFGNLKKYYVYNGGVYSSPTGGSNNTVVKESKLQDLNDIWADTSITYPENTPIYQKGGTLSRLILGTVTHTDEDGNSSTEAGRKLLTDYAYDGTKPEDEREGRNFNLVRINYTYTTDNKTKTDIKYAPSLMALLGYDIAASENTNGLDLSSRDATIRQMGSISHSLPILLTQEGKAQAKRNDDGKVVVEYTGRKDYVLFGTTQGLLSVVDAKTGIEKFSFLPQEILKNQPETLKKDGGSYSGGKDALYYGMDGEWVSHTVYVTKSDGTLTVKGAVRNVIGGEDDETQNFDGKQWVYGGMRMGGRSYYALDLTDIDNPEVKFHIDPSTGKVYSSAHPNGKEFAAIENMAQSWSKPKLDYVNWKGKRKLVMFVGGGYDAGGDHGDGLWSNNIRTGYAGYEYYNYQQDNKRGAGVYMFDADTGDLLWYVDSNTPTTPTDPEAEGEASTTTATPHLTHADLKYSVVSEIKTVDRNNDGIVDHIYFGDLGGQAFRVDFKNDGSTTGFDAQATKILNLHQANGTSPRFYLPPTFTAHHSASRKEGAVIVVASFISGNRSSPLLATVDSPSTTGKKDPLGLQYDGVYAIYDYDIHPDGSFYPATHISARTLASTNDTAAATNKLKYINVTVRDDEEDALVKGAVANSETGWGGWYYRFDKKFSATAGDGEEALQSIVKGISPLVAMEGSLYVTMYDASNNGTSSSCGAGVKGHSFTKRLCLPTGVCPENANYIYNLGAGIVNLNVGPYGDDGKKSIVVPDPDDIGVGCVGAECNTGQKFITAGGTIRFIPNRWYERFAKAN